MTLEDVGIHPHHFCAVSTFEELITVTLTAPFVSLMTGNIPGKFNCSDIIFLKKYCSDISQNMNGRWTLTSVSLKGVGDYF